MGYLRKDAKIHCIYGFAWGHLRKITVLGVFMASQAASTAENDQQITSVSLEYAFNGGLEEFEQHVNGLPDKQRLTVLDAIEEQLSGKRCWGFEPY